LVSVFREKLAFMVSELRQVSHAFIYQGHRLLLQHRDNIPDIIYPNYWGLFGGSVDSGETPAEAIRRELEEELTWTPEEIKYVLTWEELDQLLITYIFITPLTVNVSQLKLTEGQALGLFAFEQLIQVPLIPKIRLWLPQVVEAIASPELTAAWQEFNTKNVTWVIPH